MRLSPMNVALIIKILIISITLLLPGCMPVDTTPAQERPAEDPIEDEKQIEEEPPVEYLITEFEERLLQDIEQDYEVINFTSKQELIDHLSEITTDEIAEQYIEEFYREEGDKLYIIPRDGPMWIDTGMPYEVEKRSETEYLVVQEGENELWGAYRIEVTLRHNLEGWIIEDIETHAA
jgi:hypothetical protein